MSLDLQDALTPIERKAFRAIMITAATLILGSVGVLLTLAPTHLMLKL